MRTHVLLPISMSLAVVVLAVPASRAQLYPELHVQAPFTAHTNTEIPGENLKPGSYTIHIVDHLKDRYILRVDDARGKELATFIGLRNPKFDAGTAKGPVEWPNAPGKDAALRGFVFPQNIRVEFVYPKAEAVELAKLNSSTVPAIDPESEGRPVLNLSEQDRDVITLWMLTPTRVGDVKGAPAIEAERFHAATDTQLAENTPPPVPSAEPSAAPSAPPAESYAATTAAPPSPDTVLKEPVKRKTVAARLPQTASDLPLILLLSGVFLLAGFGLAARRGISRQV